MDSFIQDLYELADDCEYGSLKFELIRDRIVAGVSDRLQPKAKLSLEDAVQLSRQAEERKKNKEVVRGGTKSSEVDFIKKSGNTRSPNKPRPLRDNHKGPEDVCGAGMNGTIAKVARPGGQHARNARKRDTSKRSAKVSKPPTSMKLTTPRRRRNPSWGKFKGNPEITGMPR